MLALKLQLCKMPTWNVGLNDIAKQCSSTAFPLAVPDAQLNFKISKQDKK